MVSPNVWLSYLSKMTSRNQQGASTLGVYASLVSAAFVACVASVSVRFSARCFLAARKLGRAQKNA